MVDELFQMPAITQTTIPSNPGTTPQVVAQDTPSLTPRRSSRLLSTPTKHKISSSNPSSSSSPDPTLASMMPQKKGV